VHEGVSASAASNNVPKATTYVFASTFRDDVSIFATRIDRTQAELFRFYFSDKLLYKLTSSSSTSKDIPVAAIHVASTGSNSPKGRIIDFP
jgi:hypothetical protein